ncbi:MAG: MFS transporter [Amaricoccus sp.]
MTVTRLAADPLRRARAAVALGFALGGLGSGVWLVHIPVVTARLAIGPAVLGFALLAGNLAALAAQPLFAGLVARLGSRRATALAMPLAVASFALPVLAGSTPAFVAALLWIGLAFAFFNVAINTQAVEVQAASGRPLMSAFHGFFSLGSLAAAGIAGALIAAGLGDGRGSLAVAAVSVAGALVAIRGLVPGGPRSRPPARRRLVLPPRALLAFALLALLANAVEATVTSWGSLFLVDVKGATPSAAALGFACYSLAMAAGRFAGGAAVARFGERRVIAGGGALVAAGMAVAIAAPWFALSAAGFLVVGLGAANAIPVLISAASRVPGVAPSTGVAAVMSGGGAGYLLAPPLVGSVAQGFGLAPGLAMIAGCGLAVALTAARRRWSDTP